MRAKRDFQMQVARLALPDAGRALPRRGYGCVARMPRGIVTLSLCSCVDTRPCASTSGTRSVMLRVVPV
jgi:hypothetical protein